MTAAWSTSSALHRNLNIHSLKYPFTRRPRCNVKVSCFSESDSPFIVLSLLVSSRGFIWNDEPGASNYYPGGNESRPQVRRCVQWFQRNLRVQRQRTHERAERSHGPIAKRFHHPNKLRQAEYTLTICCCIGNTQRQYLCSGAKHQFQHYYARHLLLLLSSMSYS